MVHTPGSHLLTTNQTQIISKTRTHRSQQSILLQLFFATQCYTSGSEIWDLHAKLGLFWDQIWTLVPFGTKSQIWDFIIAPASDQELTVTERLQEMQQSAKNKEFAFSRLRPQPA